MNLKLFAAALAAALMAGAGPAGAVTTIVSAYDSVSGQNLTNLDAGPFPGGVIGADWLVKNAPSLHEVIFDEQQNVTLSQPLLTDLAGLSGPSKVGTGPTIAAGVAVDSVLIYFNAKKDGDHEATTVVFDRPILGVEYAQNTKQVSPGLTDSDFLGLSGHTYDLDCAYCGYEHGQGDTVAFSDDTLTLSSLFDKPGDYLRVILAASAVPEPAAWTLMTLGFFGLGAGLRGRRRRAARMA
jgi:hypothetical protein